MTITFTNNTIRMLTAFENITNVVVRDCFVNGDVVYYIVEKGKIGLAIGKGGNAIKNVERLLGKKIKVYEYSPDPVEFIKNLIPVSKEIQIVNQDDKLIAEIRVNRQDRGIVIGRGGERIKVYKEILRRIHNISELKVK